MTLGLAAFPRIGTPRPIGITGRDPLPPRRPRATPPRSTPAPGRRPSPAQSRSRALKLNLSSTGPDSVNLTGSYYTGSLNLTGFLQLVADAERLDPGTSESATIDFAQPGRQLWLASDDFDALGIFKPAITEFGATDVIEYQATATSAT
jgi:hypothetical protein